MKAVLHHSSGDASRASWAVSVAKVARREAASLLTSVRSKGARHANAVKRRAHMRGYQAGLAAATQDVDAIAHLLTSTLEKYSLQFREEVQVAAFHLASQVIGCELTNSTAPYTTWLTEAMKLLEQGRNYYLYHPPSLREVLRMVCSHTHARFELVEDPTLHPAHVFIKVDRGTIGFGWQEALQQAAARYQSTRGEEST